MLFVIRDLWRYSSLTLRFDLCVSGETAFYGRNGGKGREKTRGKIATFISKQFVDPCTTKITGKVTEKEDDIITFESFIKNSSSSRMKCLNGES